MKMDVHDFDNTREFHWKAKAVDGRENSIADGKKKGNGKIRKRRGLWQAVLAVIIAALAFKYMPFFNINEIIVTGNHYIPSEEVCRMAGIYKGEHILAVATDEAQQLLMKDLRIEKASVRRLLPNGIVIDIEERQPVVTVACEYGFLDLDREGLVLAAYRQPMQTPVPQLIGASVRDLYIGDTVRDKIILQVTAFLGDVGRDGVASLREISVQDTEHVVCYAPDRTEIRLGKLERLGDKALVSRDFLAELKTTRYPMEYIDLSFESPFVKLRERTEAGENQAVSAEKETPSKADGSKKDD